MIAATPFASHPLPGYYLKGRHVPVLGSAA